MPPEAATPPLLPKQQLKTIENPDGSITAVMTITFHDGTQQKYETKVSREELESVEGDFIGAELAIIGPNGEIGSLFSFVKKIGKGIGKVAKAVVTSKIMKIAATGLAIASPILGPLAPLALGASASLGIAGKLASASAAAAKGATNVAKQITEAAHVDALALTKTAAGAKSLMQAANAKRMAAETIQPYKPAAKPAAKPQPKAAAAPKKATPTKPAVAKPAAVPTQEADLLARARAGRVRSNQAGRVTDQQLLAAHRSGRIYWVS